MNINRIALSLIALFLAINALTAQHRFQDPKTQKWGYRDSEWNIIIPAIYDEVQPQFDTIIAVKKDNKMAALDDKGGVRIPLIYEHIMPNLGPFRSQFGYAAVTKDSKKSNSWGMVDSNGKLLIPETFQYVRAITPDLFVARVDGDSMLQFYNLKGELLYKIAGKSVSPSDIDLSCFSIKGIDRKTRYYKLDGSFVYPPDPIAGLWTDGHLTILRRDGKLGAILANGETLIPFEYYSIKPGVEDQFIVAHNVNTRNAGVLDKYGDVVIPICTCSIFLLDGIYGFNDLTTDKKGIFDKTGALILPAQYRFSRPYISDRELKLPDMHSERYISATHTDQSQILLRTNGDTLFSEGARRMFYHSDLHPLIIEMLPDSAGAWPLKRAVDWTGQELLPAVFGKLDFTANPKVFWGSKELHGPMGFIDLDAPEKAEFKFKHVFKQWNNYFVGQNNRDYALFSPFGQLIHEGNYLQLIEPQKKHFDRFRSTATSHLVAVGLNIGTYKDEWTGINDLGEVFQIKNAAVALVEKPVEEAEAPVHEAMPMEDFAHETEVLDVIMEEQPVPSPPKPQPPTGDKVHTWARNPPEFPGSGVSAMINFISKNLRYPELARENNISGTVVATFIVEKDGRITNINIEKGLGNGCDQEVVRLIKSMPKWKPGQTIDGVVRVKYRLPVEFKLR